MYDAEQLNEAYADRPAGKNDCGCIRLGRWSMIKPPPLLINRCKARGMKK